MPVAVCPECGRDYYLSGVSVEVARCERCGRPLVEINALSQGRLDDSDPRPRPPDSEAAGGTAAP